MRSQSLDYGLNDDHYETVHTEDTEDEEAHTAGPEERETSEEEGHGRTMVTGSSTVMIATTLLPSTDEEEEVDESKVTGDSAWY